MDIREALRIVARVAFTIVLAACTVYFAYASVSIALDAEIAGGLRAVGCSATALAAGGGVLMLAIGIDAVFLGGVLRQRNLLGTLHVAVWTCTAGALVVGFAGGAALESIDRGLQVSSVVGIVLLPAGIAFLLLTGVSGPFFGPAPAQKRPPGHAPRGGRKRRKR